jgi:hypothetical protein
MTPVMNRSVLTIFIMGILAMVMLTMFGSFFVGKVGGAEGVHSLKEDLQQIYGSAMADKEALRVVVVMENEEPGLLIEYSPNPKLANNESALRYHTQRVMRFVLGRKFWRKRARFVTIRVTRPQKPVFELRQRNERAKKPAA